MTCKLIARTNPCELWMGAEDLIAYCARVSNPSNQDNMETSEKLLKYLTSNSHWSPLEMVNLVIEVNTTRDIARQILRHRSFHFQEFSQRYADPSQLGFTKRETRLQDKKNRQNSVTVEDRALVSAWDKIQDEVINETSKYYNRALEAGIAKEVARAILPEGLTNSRLYINATLRDWFFYCQLRMGNGTQKEHQEIAKEIWEILLKEFPFLKSV